jgi:hypothetical protein
MYALNPALSRLRAQASLPAVAPSHLRLTAAAQPAVAPLAVAPQAPKDRAAQLILDAQSKRQHARMFRIMNHSRAINSVTARFALDARAFDAHTLASAAVHAALEPGMQLKIGQLTAQVAQTAPLKVAVSHPWRVAPGTCDIHPVKQNPPPSPQYFDELGLMYVDIHHTDAQGQLQRGEGGHVTPEPHQFSSTVGVPPGVNTLIYTSVHLGEADASINLQDMVHPPAP